MQALTQFQSATVAVCRNTDVGRALDVLRKKRRTRRSAIDKLLGQQSSRSGQMKHDRWDVEARFFDAVAEGHGPVKPMDPLALRRYTSPLRRRFAREFRIRA